MKNLGVNKKYFFSNYIASIVAISLLIYLFYLFFYYKSILLISGSFFGIFLLLYAYTKLFIIFRIRWQEIEGEVLQMSIGTYEHIEDTGKIIYFYPEIKYKYFVDGNEYISNQISLDGKSNVSLNKDKIRSVLKSLVFLNRVKVYVDSKDKSKSVLLTNISRKRFEHFLTFFFSGLLLILIVECIRYFVL